MRKPFAVATLSLSLLLGGCDSPSASGGGPVIRAEARSQTLSVTNTGSQSVHYLVYERVDLGVVFWGMCSPANEGCPVLAPGETLRIPYAQLGGYDPGDTEAAVYWWEATPDGNGGYRIVNADDLIVQL